MGRLVNCIPRYDKTRQEYQNCYGIAEGDRNFLVEFGNKKTLPIFEYSAQYNFIKKTVSTELNEKEIIQLWVNLYNLWIAKQLSQSGASNLQNGLWQKGIDELKTEILEMFSPSIDERRVEKRLSLDINYSEDLKNRLNSELLSAHNQKFNEYKQSTKTKMLSNKIDWFSDEAEMVNDPLFFKNNAQLVCEKILDHTNPTTFLLDTESKNIMLYRMLRFVSSIIVSSNEHPSSYSKDGVDKTMTEGNFSIECVVEVEHRLKTNAKISLLNYIKSMDPIKNYNDREFLKKINGLTNRLGFSHSDLEEVNDCILSKFLAITDSVASGEACNTTIVDKYHEFYRLFSAILLSFAQSQPITTMAAFNNKIREKLEHLLSCKTKNQVQLLLCLFLSTLLESDRQLLKKEVYCWLEQATIEQSNLLSFPILLSYIHRFFPFQEHLDVLKLILKYPESQDKNNISTLKKYVEKVQALLSFLKENDPIQDGESNDLLKYDQCKQYVMDEFVRVIRLLFDFSDGSLLDVKKLTSMLYSFANLLSHEQSGAFGDFQLEKIPMNLISRQLDEFFNMMDSKVIPKMTLHTAMTSKGSNLFFIPCVGVLREIIGKEPEEERSRHLTALGAFS